MSKVKPSSDKDGEQSDFNFTNGAVADTDLTAFQQAILVILRGCEEGRYDGGVRGGAYGLALKRTLERDEWYGEEINHGRLYPNLDTLVEKGLVEKGEADKRTNQYQLTEAGVQVLAWKLQREMACFKGETMGGGSQ